MIPLLKKLFTPKDFARYVCVTDEAAVILKSLQEHGKGETRAQRMVRRRRV